MYLAWGNSLLPKLCQVINKTDSQANHLEESVSQQGISSNHIFTDVFPGLSPASLPSIIHPASRAILLQHKSNHDTAFNDVSLC